MELSTTADWLGVIGGCALSFSWVWKFQRWLRAKVVWARAAAERGGSLVAELLENATSPARRSDIHAYVQFRCIEIEASRTRQVVVLIAMGMSAALLGLLMMVLHRIFDTDQSPWLWWIVVTNYVASLIAFCMSMFFGWQLRHVELGWQQVASKVLGERALRHVVAGEI